MLTTVKQIKNLYKPPPNTKLLLGGGSIFKTPLVK